MYISITQKTKKNSCVKTIYPMHTFFYQSVGIVLDYLGVKSSAIYKQQGLEDS